MLTFQTAPFAARPLGAAQVIRFVENEERWFRGWMAITYMSMVPWIAFVVARNAFSGGLPPTAWDIAVFWLILSFGLFTTAACFLIAIRHKDKARVLYLNELSKQAWIERVQRGRTIESYAKVPIEDVRVVMHPLRIKGFATPLRFGGFGLVAHCGDAWIVLGVAKTKTELETCVLACFANGLRVEESEEQISSELNIRIKNWRRGLQDDVHQAC
ncbi:MAG: hypothetical protein RIB58_08525 [Phycisphaerales bacterium]